MPRREVKQNAPAAAPAQQQPKMPFDAWWAMTHKKIPACHHKEVILADFKSRGLSTQEPLSTYNKALEQYGIKTK